MSVPFVTGRLKPTNDPKDAQDVGGKDDQQVDEREQDDGDGDVARPVEGLVGKHHLLNSSPDLFRGKGHFQSLQDESNEGI